MYASRSGTNSLNFAYTVADRTRPRRALRTCGHAGLADDPNHKVDWQRYDGGGVDAARPAVNDKRPAAKAGSKLSDRTHILRGSRSGFS